MSKFIMIGSVAVALNDLKSLSGEDKVRVLDSMFNGSGMEVDEHGQIIQYTGLKFGDAEGNTAVPLSVDPNDVEDDDSVDPYEDEEEPVSSDDYMGDESLPPTLRPSQLPVAS